ncbi:MAG: TPM domain-containing protein [Legionella sp.]|nr:TPM domain-containing protein [Legionella sp.]
MKFYSAIALFFLGLISFSSSYADAIIYPELPKKNNFVVDQTHTLNQSDKEKLNAIAFDVWHDESIPIVTVFIHSLASVNAEDKSIEAYTQHLFDHWKLGLMNKNYGVILLVSLQDRKARIEFGKDWHHRYDHAAEKIMRDDIIPHFKVNQYAKGVIVGVDGISQLVREVSPETPWWVIVLEIGLWSGLIAMIISLFRAGRSGWAWAIIAGLCFAILFIAKRGFSLGGRSGGGGATGSW